MTRRQAAFILVANAIASTLISLSVVLLALRFAKPVIPPAPVPTALTLPSPTPTRRTVAVNHTVRKGETLSDIALLYGVPPEVIIAANNIKDPNMLIAGQILVIPPPAAPTRPGSPAVTPTPLPEATPAPPSLRIVAVLPSLDGQRAQGEMVVLTNTGGRVNLKGWTLSDAQRNVYAFPDFVLERGATVRLHSEAGLDTATDLYWGRTAAAFQSSTTLFLKDPAGTVLATQPIGGR